MSELHYITHNIIIGQAELYYLPHKKGWIVPGESIITNQVEAIKYACALNDYITKATVLKNQRKKR